MEQNKFEIILINDESEFSSKMASDICGTVDVSSCQEETSDTCILGDYDSDCTESDYCTIDIS